ncbi:MAG: substrate-binding periplasmic protein [Parachlamydiaceae bacterium]
MKTFLSFVKQARWVLIALVALFFAYMGYRWISPPLPGVYKVAIDTTWYPMSFYGRESSITAFSIDVLFSIARREKIQLDLVYSGPKRIAELLDDELVHGILTGMKPDPILEETYYFSEPYYRLGAVLVIRKEDDFTSLLNLPSKRVAVRRNSPILFKVQVDPKATIIPFDSPVGALEQLVRGEVDAVVIDKLLTYLYYGGSYQDKLKVVTLPLTVDGLRLVTLQDSAGEALIEAFNEGLKQIKEEGVYDEFLNQWDLYNPDKL